MFHKDYTFILRSHKKELSEEFVVKREELNGANMLNKQCFGYSKFKHFVTVRLSQKRSLLLKVVN